MTWEDFYSKHPGVDITQIHDEFIVHFPGNTPSENEDEIIKDMSSVVQHLFGDWKFKEETWKRRS